METSNRVLDAVLRDFSLPHIEERVPRDAFYKLGLKFPLQYGIAACDVAECVRRAEMFGAGPFIHGTVAAPNWIERGEPIPDCKLEVAIGYAGDAEIEFLGPGEGTHHYSRALIDTDVALHHVGIYQHGMPEIAERFEAAGFPEAVRGGVQFGKALNIDFRYFDSRDTYGLSLEVLDLSALGRPLSYGPAIKLYSKLRDMIPL